MTQTVDVFFTSGCGRCSFFDTPQCKIHKWRDALFLLRDAILSTGLEEKMKWGFPCYTADNKNIVMLGALKDACMVSFFKGSLLSDPHQILTKAGENSQVARLVRFTNVDQVLSLTPAILEYVNEAIVLEKSGAKVAHTQKNDLVFPQELLEAFTDMPQLEKAFRALTPGRQRGYILFFLGAKQTATKISRIKKCTPAILQGKGMHD
jgi:uncharacterized protein YdeI (YjbR/CyaY-like superfamily)